MAQNALISHLNFFLYGALALTISASWNNVISDRFKNSRYYKHSVWTYPIIITIVGVLLAYIINAMTQYATTDTDKNDVKTLLASKTEQTK
jgi:hypothetical protein